MKRVLLSVLLFALAAPAAPATLNFTGPVASVSGVLETSRRWLYYEVKLAGDPTPFHCFGSIGYHCARLTAGQAATLIAEPYASVRLVKRIRVGGVVLQPANVEAYQPVGSRPIAFEIRLLSPPGGLHRLAHSDCYFYHESVTGPGGIQPAAYLPLCDQADFATRKISHDLWCEYFRAVPAPAGLPPDLAAPGEFELQRGVLASILDCP